MADLPGSPVSNPRVGMLARVRNRLGIITEVRDFDGSDGRVHLIHIEYGDDHSPRDERLIWELEPTTRLLEPNALPNIESDPMPSQDFDALLRAARWSAISPFLDDEGSPLQRLPVSSPFHGAVEVDDYQLVPLLKALRMPRVNLLIADDVGLGKTIEAGLILSELLIRRRVNRILILTPAALRNQWRDEMWSKFSLPFDVIDRGATLKLRRSLGVDANPWRSCSRAIASYHYLRQPDVLEEFLSIGRSMDESGQLPWDLLIVDEVHNLMPAPYGEDSQLCKMLGIIAPQFEHRLYLTATPHNGKTRSFTGLLEMLDPVRFTRTDTLRPAEKERIKQVVIRRLKREINERTDPPRFCTRNPPQAVVLEFGPAELALLEAFDNFRSKVRKLIAESGKRRRLAGGFAIEILGKRMLSGPMTFLESWQRCKLGLVEEDSLSDDDVVIAHRTVEEETDDDLEAQRRGSTAASVIGSWMKPIAEHLKDEIAGIDAAAQRMGVRVTEGVIEQNPREDARFSALSNMISTLTRHGDSWAEDERIVVFTEYKTTLDYLLRRLREAYPGEESRFLCLYGGMDDLQRDAIKDAFNDEQNDVRILIATDAASEGLNLQTTARYLLHYDCPWNPSRLEQRNGRLDRHGQARDVTVHHFASEEAADLKFLAFLIRKVDQIREDLGSTGELFDEATHRRLVEGADLPSIQRQLEEGIARVAESRVPLDADSTIVLKDLESELEGRLEALSSELDLDPGTGRDTLETAMADGAGRPQLTESDELERFSICNPSLPGWKDLIDETVRKTTTSGVPGPVPKLSFSPKPFLTSIGPRTVFRPRVDTQMLHLGHPLVKKAIGTLTRRRYPGPSEVSRWTVRFGSIPDGMDALVLLSIEELGVNELRETFHHWVRTVQLPIVGGELGQPLPHVPAAAQRSNWICHDDESIERARDLLDEVSLDLGKLVRQWRQDLTANLIERLAADGTVARKDEEQRYQSRQAEVSTLIAENTMSKLEREIDSLQAERKQGYLFASDGYLDELDRSIQIKQEELDRRRDHYEEVRKQLAKERERILQFLLPRRYSLQGQAQVFPVVVEIRIPDQPHGGAS